MDEAGFIEGYKANSLVVGKTGIRTFLKKIPGSKVWNSFIKYTNIVIVFLVIFKRKMI